MLVLVLVLVLEIVLVIVIVIGIDPLLAYNDGHEAKGTLRGWIDESALIGR